MGLARQVRQEKMVQWERVARREILDYRAHRAKRVQQERRALMANEVHQVLKDVKVLLARLVHQALLAYRVHKVHKVHKVLQAKFLELRSCRALFVIFTFLRRA
ncbi:hypothetical protein YSY43_41100 [Paenibacillus sp. YSY-4.3]